LRHTQHLPGRIWRCVLGNELAHATGDDVGQFVSVLDDGSQPNHTDRAVVARRSVLQGQRQRRRAGASVQGLEGAQAHPGIGVEVGQPDLLPGVGLASGSCDQRRQRFLAGAQEQQSPAQRGACRPVSVRGSLNLENAVQIPQLTIVRVLARACAALAHAPCGHCRRRLLTQHTGLPPRVTGAGKPARKGR
jgi:hypothetical protein